MCLVADILQYSLKDRFLSFSPFQIFATPALRHEKAKFHIIKSMALFYHLDPSRTVLR